MMYYDGNPILYDNNYDENFMLNNLTVNQDYIHSQFDFPELPTGEPTGPSPTPLMPEMPGEQTPLTVESTEYLPGYLKTQIGKNVRVEFLIGSSGPLVDRIGRLLQVGISYITIQPIESDDILVCDLYSIKFVYIYE